jgi:DNA polymerase III subunit epsilon
VGDNILMNALPKNLCFVDIETTGCSLYNDRIIEIGILRVEDGEVIKTFSSLINPQVHVPPEIELLTGITGMDVEAAPSFYELKQEIKEVLDGCVFVAHNVRFDYSFLKTEFKRYDIEFTPKQFCTVKLSRSLFPQYRHHNLDSIIERFGFINERRHRAFDDAKVLWEFYQKVRSEFGDERLLEAVAKAMKRPTVPVNLPIEFLESLPDKPGVYIFYGENKLPLYIGKSVSIKKRVMSHFSSDHLSSIELKIAQQVKNIDVIVTAGELGALLKEASLIKQMQPLYNRKLRQKHKMLAVRSVTGPHGYESVELIDANEIDVNNLDSVIGIFKSRKAAQSFLLNKSKEHELCERWLGLENTKSACFAYRLGKCKGACSGKELPVMYNMRFAQAFFSSRFQRWPYSTAVVVKELGVQAEKSEAFILDKWCYLGSIREEGQLRDIEMRKDLEFDLDTYKILQSFIKHKRGVAISPINLEQLQLF